MNTRNKYVIRDLENIQNLHVTISKAFPEIHGEAKFFKENQILFRLDIQKDVPFVIVQSKIKPNWDHLNNQYLIKDPEYIENIDQKYNSIKENNVFNFRIRINASKKVNNKRVPITKIDELINWFRLRAKNNGFKINTVSLKNEGPVYIYSRNKITYNSVLFEGILSVIDSIKFIECLKNGIGQGKSYGFGMLSIRN
ncbi:MAG TPA: type I-E CRISPR-associated protein Cas6/Cse3/CasE [bacterium]|jgi:CRISPR system Cascade subunit CasE|nr:type I-E CRISPR-associated protein Cas6/Cse3/CasE [bacterium]